MKNYFKLFVLLFILMIGSLLQASELAATKSDPPYSDLAGPMVECCGYYFPHAAVNTDSGETLIFSAAGSRGAFGKILDLEGNATSKKIPVIHGTIAMGDAAYNPIQKEYLLVYEKVFNSSGNHAIHGLRLNANLKAIGKEFNVIQFTPTTQNINPRVVFNPQTMGYTLVWEIQDKNDTDPQPGTPDSGVNFVSLNQSGKPVGTKITVAKNPGSNGFYDNFGAGRILDFTYNPVRNKLLMLFQQRSNKSTGDFFVVTLDPTLKGPIDIHKVNSKPVDSELLINGGNLGLLPDGTTVVFYATNKNAQRRSVDLNGKFHASSSAFAASNNRFPYHDLKGAFSTTSSGTAGLLIASNGRSDAESGNCYCSDAQQLDSVGKPKKGGGSTILGLDNFDMIKNHGSLLIALPTNRSDKLHKFVWLQTLSDAGGVNGRILKVVGNF